MSATLAEQMNDPDFCLKRRNADELIARYGRLGREIEKLYAELVSFEGTRSSDKGIARGG